MMQQVSSLKRLIHACVTVNVFLSKSNMWALTEIGNTDKLLVLFKTNPFCSKVGNKMNQPTIAW